MALVTPSELFSNIRGSIGSTTFSHARAGLIAKRKSNGRKAYTNKQGNIIKYQSFNASQWQNLSMENQELWNDYADLYTQIDKFGTTKNLSGFNWFCHMNNYSKKYFNTLIEAPPEREAADIVPDFSVALSESSIELTFESAINSPNHLLFIFASLPLQLTSTGNRGRIRLIKSVEDPDLTTLDITSDWEEYFNISYPAIAVNSKFNIQVFAFMLNTNSYQNSVGIWAAGSVTPPPPWSPIDLPSLFGWWRADLGITLESGNVSQWADQSGNDYTLIQDTATNQPLYVASSINGLPSLSFDNTNDYMKISPVTLNQGCTVIALFKSDGNTDAYNDLFDGNSGNTGVCELTYSSPNHTIVAYAGTAGTIATIDITEWHLVIINFNGASSKAWVDNNSVITGNFGSANMGGFTLGSNGSPSFYFGGNVAECIITSNNISDDNVAEVKAYINDRYNTSF